MKADLNQMLINISKRTQRGLIFRKGKTFWLDVYYDQGWTHIFTVFRERKYFFWPQLKRDPDSAPTPPPKHTHAHTSPMPSAFLGEEFEVVFLLSASSCFHSPIRWGFCSCWLWLKSSPGAQQCKSLCSEAGDSGQTFQSVSVLNTNIWWIPLFISSGEKSQTVDGSLCPGTNLVFPTHRLLFHYTGLQLETWEK